MREDFDGIGSRRDRHLRKRCQQRGVRKRELHMILDAADRHVPLVGGRVSITLSHRAVAVLRAEGVAPAELERVRRRAVVVDADGYPITVIIPFGRRGRSYRRRASRRQR